MKLNDMRELLGRRDIRLTRSLGQNFLHDGNQLRRIVEAAALQPGDRILEIGPGLGPLTEALIAKAGSVLAIEKDGRLVEVLKERFADSHVCDVNAVDPATIQQPSLTLLHADALEFLQQQARDWSAWKLVANLPYSVASPILVELAQSGRAPERLVATLQIEVARRIMAGAGTADYGLLTLLLQLHYEPAGWFKIPAGCFFPAPDVDSACITLVRRAGPLLMPSECDVFVRLVKRAFSQRRKMMLKLLKAEWPGKALNAALLEAGLQPDVRAESVGLEAFAAMARALAAE